MTQGREINTGHQQASPHRVLSSFTSWRRPGLGLFVKVRRQEWRSIHGLALFVQRPPKKATTCMHINDQPKHSSQQLQHCLRHAQGQCLHAQETASGQTKEPCLGTATLFLLDERRSSSQVHPGLCQRRPHTSNDSQSKEVVVLSLSVLLCLTNKPCPSKSTAKSKRECISSIIVIIASQASL